MAANRGAIVAGIDAAEQLIAIAAERTSGDFDQVPWMRCGGPMTRLMW
jgi:hypothetical protein